jgi:hypothetical protein
VKIIRLEAENFKRLRVVNIAPAGNVVEITGQNGEGKTSALDAIWAALGGKPAAPAKPIRSGEQQAHVTLTLGEGDEVKLKVTRTFNLKEGVPYTTDLKVESGEGARFDKPQNILNTMVGALCFDPLAFTRMKPADQVTALRALVPDVDFATMDGLNRRDFEERTEVNRRAVDLRAQARALPVAEGDVPVRVDVAALEAKLAEAADHNTLIATRKANREAAELRLQGHEERAKGMREQAAALIAGAEEEEGLAANLRDQLAKAEPLPAPIDVAGVQSDLAAARQTNALVDRVDQRRALEARAEEQETQSLTLTRQIETRKEEAAAAVAAAKMPVEGLGFADGEDGPFVTLGAEPFDQASQAQKIRVSVAIAAAMNPKLRVARILDGSLLDANSWAALEEYAAKHDVQIWIETISQHGEAAVLMQDGSTPVDEAKPAVAEVGDVI